MNTKITPKMMSKMLKIFHDDYEKEFGHGVRNIHLFPILSTGAGIYLKRMPELKEKDGNMVRYRIVDILKELEKIGMMRSNDGVRFFFTPQGYEEASKSKWDRFVEYWNVNPGFNTVIAIVSAIVSVISLVVAIIALSKPGS